MSTQPMTTSLDEPAPAPDESPFLFTPPFGVEVIKQIIPHRYPFLLIDRITAMGEDWVQGYKNLSANEGVFDGHFPQEPVYPGVMMIETFAQAGACWILSHREHHGKLAYLMTIESAKFRSKAVPGDRIEIDGKITNLRSRTGRIVGKLTVEDRLICEATLTFAFAAGKN
ncbi:MAG: 3-hydroxyacyl-ACP dehydratase FabZ [Sumerlaeia bacterium]